MKYPIAIEPGTDTTAWGVIVPDMPGCFSAGDTIDEAIANAEEAIDAWCELTAESGQEIPPPSDMEALVRAQELKGAIWLLLDVDVSRYQGPAERINITIPRRVLQMIDAHLANSPESHSAFLARAATMAISMQDLPGKAMRRPAKGVIAPSGKKSA